MVRVTFLFSLPENLAIEDMKKLGFKQYATLSREEQYELELQKSAYAFSMQKKLGLTDMAESFFFREWVWIMVQGRKDTEWKGFDWK